MTEKLVLPFEIDVEMRAYHNKSFPLGAIKANIKDYDIWMANKLINCVWRKGGVLDSVDTDIWSSKDGLTFVQNMWVSPKMFCITGLELLEFVRNMLRECNYVTGGYDEFYIPNKSAYKKYHFNHDYILLGFDNEKQIFKSAAYVEDGRYKCYDITYSDYYDAVTKNESIRSSLNFYKINIQYNPKLDIEKIIDTLKCYCVVNDMKTNQNIDIYGIDAWEMFADYVKNCRGGLDVRFGRLYMEHHLIMFKRFQTLEKFDYIKNKQLIKRYEQIYLKTQAVHFLFLKYNITKDKSLLEKISKTILTLVPIERNLINGIIQTII